MQHDSAVDRQPLDEGVDMLFGENGSHGITRFLSLGLRGTKPHILESVAPCRSHRARAGPPRSAVEQGRRLALPRTLHPRTNSPIRQRAGSRTMHATLPSRSILFPQLSTSSTVSESNNIRCPGVSKPR